MVRGEHRTGGSEAPRVMRFTSGWKAEDLRGFREPPSDLIAEAAEVEERITQVIAGLTESQRTVLQLGRVDGLTTAEIAHRLAHSI